jgi:acetyltransferase-like isoleucine patch superfamily enzyme
MPAYDLRIAKRLTICCELTGLYSETARPNARHISIVERPMSRICKRFGMRNLAFFYRLRARVSRGSLFLAKDLRLPWRAKIIWRSGSVSIGAHNTIRDGVILDAQKGSIVVGDNVSFNDYTIVLGHGGVHIGNDVRIAAQVLITSFEHNFDDPTQPIRLQGNTNKTVIIEDDVWIGAGAKILAGAHISHGCVIGANAVVKGETVPFGVYGGIPARLLKMRGNQKASSIVSFPGRT